MVAPYVGAWIETEYGSHTKRPHYVAPYVGAWIETGNEVFDDASSGSHPTWVRGLKLVKPNGIRLTHCRTLRGCVD